MSWRLVLCLTAWLDSYLLSTVEQVGADWSGWSRTSSLITLTVCDCVGVVTVQFTDWG